MANNNRTFELIDVVDLRPINLDTGKRESLRDDEKAECDRCGKAHAIVWTIHETTPGKERFWTVGSTCGPKILDGWEPEKKEVNSLRKADRLRAAQTAWRPLIEQAITIGKAAYIADGEYFYGGDIAHEVWKTLGEKMDLSGLEESGRDVCLRQVAEKAVLDPNLTVDGVLAWAIAPWAPGYVR